MFCSLKCYKFRVAGVDRIPHFQTIEMARGHVRIQSVLRCILVCELDVAIDLSLSVAVLEITWKAKHICELVFWISTETISPELAETSADNHIRLRLKGKRLCKKIKNLMFLANFETSAPLRIFQKTPKQIEKSHSSNVTVFFTEK